MELQGLSVEHPRLTILVVEPKGESRDLLGSPSRKKPKALMEYL
jgi:hypothetical protein